MTAQTLAHYLADIDSSRSDGWCEEQLGHATAWQVRYVVRLEQIKRIRLCGTPQERRALGLLERMVEPRLN